MWPDLKPRFGISRKTVAIQYMSDLHLERLNYQWTITPAAPILLLVGDVGRLSDLSKYRSFILHCCAKYTKILLVAGNHEYYGTSHEKVSSSPRKSRAISLRRVECSSSIARRTMSRIRMSRSRGVRCTRVLGTIERDSRMTSDGYRSGVWMSIMRSMTKIWRG